MDLTEWISQEHRGVADRLAGALIGVVPPDRWHEQADGGGSTLAGLLFHFSWHADLAAGVIDGGLPVLEAHQEALGLAGVDRWAGLSETEDRTVTERIGFEALLAYHRSVWNRTAELVAGLGADRLGRVPEAGAAMTSRGVTQAAVPWLHGMWRAKPVAWLVQWPLVGHPYSHVGEMISIRNRMGLSPF
jgi:hypothetical protein